MVDGPRDAVVIGAVRSWAAVGIDPADTGLAPTRALPLALSRARLATVVEVPWRSLWRPAAVSTSRDVPAET
jgi:acetyl-CoA C-acetyltransferase